MLRGYVLHAMRRALALRRAALRVPPSIDLAMRILTLLFLPCPLKKHNLRQHPRSPSRSMDPASVEQSAAARVWANGYIRRNIAEQCTDRTLGRLVSVSKAGFQAAMPFLWESHDSEEDLEDLLLEAQSVVSCTGLDVMISHYGSPGLHRNADDSEPLHGILKSRTPSRFGDDHYADARTATYAVPVPAVGHCERHAL